MPVELNITEDRSGILITGSFDFHGPEIVRVKKEFEQSESEVRDFSYWLVDLRRVTSLEISTDDIKELVEIDRRLARRMPNAAVAIAAPLDAAFGIARMWEIMVEGIGWPTGVFRDYFDAELWVHARMAHISQMPSDPPNMHV